MADRAVVASAVAFLLTAFLLGPTGRTEVATAADDQRTTAGEEVASTSPTIPAGPSSDGPVTVQASAADAAFSEDRPATDQAVTDQAHTGGPHPDGLLTFRGNATRTFHGTGPPGQHPSTEWGYPAAPASAMCAESTVGEETRTWCGTGWTGQPAVFDRDGRTWVVFGAYDRAVHFVDGDTGEAILPPFGTGDIIKGSVTVDPDGFPIVYSGSRDGRYRAIAFDGDEPRELWSLSAADATGPTMWNDDWDGAGLIVDDHLVVGGENSRLFVVRLDRGHDRDGRVTLDAEVVADVAGWDDDLLAAAGDRNVSIESSVAVHDGVVWFVNSGGLVQGWDLSSLMAGEPEQVFRWWFGDDADATVVVDPPTGDLIVASEWERHTDRSLAAGQIVRLDPDAADPQVWGVADPRVRAGDEVAGVWGTPALWRDQVIVPTTSGTLLGLDAASGTQQWSLDLGDHLWSSPVIIDDVLVQGACDGTLHAFDLADDAPPEPRWTVALDGCIESTPAVWEGRLYVGTRAGRMHGVSLG